MINSNAFKDADFTFGETSVEIVKDNSRVNYVYSDPSTIYSRKKEMKFPKQDTLLYRAVCAIGRWSMLDMFMISILVALVNMGVMAYVEAGRGATAFATAVVITILAAASFDPRLIWMHKMDDN